MAENNETGDREIEQFDDEFGEEEDEEEEGIISVKHNIPYDAPRDLNFGFLKPEDRRIEQEGFDILPVERYDDGSYAFVVQFADEKTQQPCYILEDGTETVGWCRCQAFGMNDICRDLYAAYKWKQGMAEAENEEHARQAIEKLRAEAEEE